MATSSLTPLPPPPTPPPAPPADDAAPTIIDRAPSHGFAAAETPVSAYPLADQDETPLLLTGGRPGTPPPVIEAPAAPPPQPSGAALVAQWASKDTHRKPLPRPARTVLLVVGGIALLVGAFTVCTGGPAAERTRSEALYEDLVVSEETLRKRRVVSRDEFRQATAGSAAQRLPPEAATAEADEAPSIDLEERRRRRADNPDDVRYHRGRTRPHRPPASGGEPEEVSIVEDLVIHKAEDDGATKEPASSTKHARLRAGDSVRARLAAPLRLAGRSASAIATIEAGPLRGARLLGRATADADGRVTILFRTLVWQDAEHRIRAEAHDRSGLPSLAGEVSGASAAGRGRDGGGLASRTGGRILRHTVGGGLAGAVAEDAYETGTHRRPAPRRRPVVSLPKGERFRAFFVSGVKL